ncbi:MAG: AAA family ATPase [bacterium]
MMPSNIWNTFGIRTSPFFQEALDSSSNSLRPIDLFVGRAQEAEAALVRIVGRDSSRNLITGVAGVGKTTFIQHLKALLEKDHGFAVTTEHCRVPHDLSATTLGAELLRSVIRSLRAGLPPNRLESLAGFDTSRRLVEETERYARQVSLSVLGSGAGFGSGAQIDRPPFLPSQFHDALAELASSALREGIEGTVVHLNNLENLESNPMDAAQLFRDARDYFLVPGVHVLLGAVDSFPGAVLSTHAQVRSIFPPPMVLAALSFEEVSALLEKRIEYVAIDGMQPLLPVTLALVRDVFELFRGDLRGMFNALEEACFQALGTLRPEPLDVEDAHTALSPIYRRQLLLELSEAEVGHLVQLLRLGTEEFRQADTIDLLKISQGRVSGLFGTLERAQTIVPVRTEGRSQYYALSGRTLLAFEGA